MDKGAQIATSQILMDNMKLLQKQQLLKANRLGSLVEIQKMLEVGEADAARTLAMSLRESTDWHKVVSIFKEVSPQPGMCKCGGRERLTLDESTLMWKTDGSCFSCALDEQAKRELRDKETFVEGNIRHPEELLIQIGVPEKYRTSSKVDFGSSYDDLFNNSGGLYLYGPSGSGKTRLAVALIRDELPRLATEKVDFQWRVVPSALPLFITMGDFVMDLTSATSAQGAGEWGSMKSTLQRLCSKKLVVIDDFDIVDQPPWVLMALFSVLDRRYRTSKRTILTSQKSILSIKEADKKIASRIAGMCTLRRVEL